VSEHQNPDVAPPARVGLLWLTGVLLIIPMLALIPVGWYSKQDPKLGPFPFFIWYQLLWVPLTAGFCWAAYIVVQKARPYRAIEPVDQHAPTEGDA